MNITCRCGDVIHDGTDGLPHKGHMVADRDWNPFWDAVDAALVVQPASEDATMALRRKARAHRMWECAGCGRLWIEAAGGVLLSYAPETGRANRPFAR